MPLYMSKVLMTISLQFTFLYLHNPFISLKMTYIYWTKFVVVDFYGSRAKSYFLLLPAKQTRNKIATANMF